MVNTKMLSKCFGGNAKVIKTLTNSNQLIRENYIEAIDECLIMFLKGIDDISEYIKPILRQLESITDDECKGLALLSIDFKYLSENDFVIDRKSIPYTICVYSGENVLYIGFNGSIKWNIKGEFNGLFNFASVFDYLESKYFDIGLFPIGSYLVIDVESGELIEPKDYSDICKNNYCIKIIEPESNVIEFDDVISNEDVIESVISDNAIEIYIEPENNIDEVIICETIDSLYIEQEIVPVEIINVIDEDLELYSHSVLNAINNSFHMRVQGSVPVNELASLIKQLSKDYSYQLKGEVGSTFLEIRKGDFLSRIPNDKNSFIKTRS